MTEVVAVDVNTHTVETAQGQQYWGDFLVLAAGSQANFFGTPGAEQMRSRILAMLESADRDPSLLAKGALNFVIVGAGATDTEMAGAFGDMLQAGLKKKAGDGASRILLRTRGRLSSWTAAMLC